MYIYPPLLTRRVPTPKDIQTAMKLADHDDAKARDVRPLMSILMRMANVSARIKGHVLTRKTAVSAFTWQVTTEDKNLTDKAEEARMRCRRVIDEIITNQVQAPLYDVFLLELLWEDVNLYKVPTIVKKYKPVEIDKINDYKCATFLDDKTTKVEHEIDTNLDNANFIVDISDDDERGGLLRSIVTQSVLEYDMMMEWSNFNKKLKGILQGIYEREADDDEIKAATEALQSAVKNNFLLTSDAISFKLNEIVKGNGQSFKEQLESLKADISVAILGQVNTTELPKGSGSRAALQVMNLIRADIHYNDIIRCEKIINDQLLLTDYRLNRDPNATEAPWKFSFIIPEDLDFEQRIDAITKVYEAGLPIVASEAYTHMGLTKPDTVADTLQKAAEAL